VSSIQQWHVGKLVLLWGASPLVVLLAALVASEGGIVPSGEVLAVILVGSAYVLFCCAITWVWLSGREK